MKIIIAGSRDFKDYVLLTDVIRVYQLDGTIPSSAKDVEIVSGLARGADLLGVQLAKDFDLVLTEFPLDWGKYNKAAGYRRNVEMADYGDMLIAFWDGKSKGTGHMIGLARAKRLLVKVIRY